MMVNDIALSRDRTRDVRTPKCLCHVHLHQDSTRADKVKYKPANNPLGPKTDTHILSDDDQAFDEMRGLPSDWRLSTTQII